MTVGELKKILKNVDDNLTIAFEYSTKPHIYIVEKIQAARKSSDELVFLSRNFES